MRKEPMNVRLWSSKSSFRLWKAVGKGVDERSYSSYIARFLLPGHSLFASSCLPWNFSRWGSSTKEEEAAAKGRQAQNLWAHFRAQNPSTRAHGFSSTPVSSAAGWTREWVLGLFKPNLQGFVNKKPILKKQINFLECV